jgi:chemotaxis protein histidine kinase CheA
MFQLAQFEQERLGEAWSQAFQVEQFEYEKTQDEWNQKMQLLEYQANREAEMWTRKMDQAANARANAALTLQKQQAKAAADAANAQKTVANALAAHNNERKAFELMVDRWDNLGYADDKVAEFFADYGVTKGAYVETAGWSNLITTMENQYETEAIELSRKAADAGYAAYATDYLESYQRDVSASVPVGSTVDTATQNMKLNYYNFRASATTIDGKSADEDHLAAKFEELATAKNEYGELKYEAAMGSYYYDKLYEELAGKLSTISMSDY